MGRVGRPATAGNLRADWQSAHHNFAASRSQSNLRLGRTATVGGHKRPANLPPSPAGKPLKLPVAIDRGLRGLNATSDSGNLPLSPTGRQLKLPVAIDRGLTADG